MNHNEVQSCFPSTYLDVQDPDEVGPQGVVFDQTGHPAASLVPAGVPVCREHLDHCCGQGLERRRERENVMCVGVFCQFNGLPPKNDSRRTSRFV